MMQDRKALQAGTSHFLGQNFSKAQEIKFLGQEGKEEYAWTTSWGVSTRLVGALIMTHSDDDGLVLPPMLAPAHVAILPIYRSDDERMAVLDYCRKLEQELRNQPFGDGKVGVLLDDRDIRGGEKTWHHVKRGVPIRLEVGPRDIQSDSVFMARRDLPPSEKKSVPRGEMIATVGTILAEMQRNLFERALKLREEATQRFDDRKQLEAYFTPQNAEQPEIHGGFAMVHCADVPEVNDTLKEWKVTVRCIPLEGEPEPGKCIFTGQPTTKRVVLAKAY
jgi:prolyl-tRNA synthetase